MRFCCSPLQIVRFYCIFLFLFVFCCIFFEHKKLKKRRGTAAKVRCHWNHHAHDLVHEHHRRNVDPINCYFRDAILDSDAFVARPTNWMPLDEEKWMRHASTGVARARVPLNKLHNAISDHTLHSIALRPIARLHRDGEKRDIGRNSPHRRYVNVHMEMIKLNL